MPGTIDLQDVSSAVSGFDGRRVGKSLKALRERHEISLETMSGALHINKRGLELLEEDATHMHLFDIVKVASAFGYTPQGLVKKLVSP